MKTAEVYTVKDICEILSIGRNTAYRLITKAPFRVIKIGDVYRIPKDGFDDWLHQKNKSGVSQ